MKQTEQQAPAVAFDRWVRQARWDNGLITLTKPGHTREASTFPQVHPGRETAAYYAAGVMSGRIGAGEGSAMLHQLSLLQEKDRAAEFFGGFRWYREETAIHDTNAAFFIMSPLVHAVLLNPEQVPDAHGPILKGMMEGAREWFARECREPSLYYPNKIISDGALLLALAKLTAHAERFEEGTAFFRRWLDYTRRRGWGWGENMSLGYLGIILSSLQLAAYCLKDAHQPLAQELYAEIRGLLELIRFHDRHEFVPTIRSYNFQGEVERPGAAWQMAGYGEGDTPAPELPDLWMVPALALNARHTAKAVGLPERAEQPVPRIRRERVMDDAEAYTWIGSHARLGSLNRFPVLAGCYQWPTWGLGWQSFPASFSVDGEQVGYLRWTVRERERSAPIRPSPIPTAI
ncbi:hypothetical protein N6H14_05535 [Paenibacillus sp. CC-CFT747]|nr:hypothetical protein N6H14_05535 [Paenibacillus sp. CC-CFT747]